MTELLIIVFKDFNNPSIKLKELVTHKITIKMSFTKQNY